MISPSDSWKSFLGCNLKGISGLYYEDAGLDLRNPLAVGLDFCDRVVQVSSGEFGEGLSIANSPISPVDMGDQGALVVRELTSEPSFSALTGGGLQSFDRVLGLDLQDDLGVILKFTTGELWICNIGDEIWIDRQMPASLVGDVELVK